MKGKINWSFLLAIFFGLALFSFETITPVQAATVPKTGYVRVKSKKRIQLYQSNGRKTSYYVQGGHQYHYNCHQYLKIGGHKNLAYRLSNNYHWLLAKNGILVATVNYQKAQLVLPAGYTRSALLQAYQGKPSPSFIKSCMQGMQTNSFSRTKTPESRQDNQTLVQPANLTKTQQKEITLFALRLINQARKQIGLRPWVISAGTQKLAQDIATEYTAHQKGINNGGHYVAGIVRACHKNGLALDDNYVEDMAGFSSKNKYLTMTALKKDVYFGLKQMIFGYAGSSEARRKLKSNYHEWQHAGDLFNTQGSQHDGDYDYFGFSISKNGHVYSLHYISVPTFIVKSSKYNQGFKP